MSNEITKEQAAIQNELFMMFGHRIERHAGAGENGKKERIWFSPHCQKPDQQTLL